MFIKTYLLQQKYHDIPAGGAPEGSQLTTATSFYGNNFEFSYKLSTFFLIIVALSSHLNQVIANLLRNNLFLQIKVIQIIIYNPKVINS